MDPLTTEIGSTDEKALYLEINRTRGIYFMRQSDSLTC